MSQRVKAAMRGRAVRGEALGKPPYGYRIGKARKFEVQPDEAELVQAVYRLYLEGLGIRLIAGRLNQEGKRTRRGGRWSMVTIRDMLHSRVYLGTYSRFGMRIPNNHPPVISAHLFRQVQARLARKRPEQRPRQRSAFLLSGLLACGYCGNSMIGVSRRQRWVRQKDGVQREGQYRYYQCESRTNQSVCGYHTWKVADLDEAVRLGALERLREAAEASPTPGGRDGAAGEEAHLKAQMGEIEEALGNLVERAAAGEIGAEALRGQAFELVSRKRRLRSLLSKPLAPDAAEPGQQRAVVLGKIWELEREWGRLDFPAQRRALEQLVQHVRVFEDRFELQLKAPWSIS